MHYLHCILVDLMECVQGPLDTCSEEEIEDMARTHAMDATEGYGSGNVFDWRTENDAGRWSVELPGKGVVLGSKDPERFLRLFEEYSQLPLVRALEHVRCLQGRCWKWRAKAEIERDGCRVFENEANGTDGLYWSALPVGPMTVDQDLIREIWDNEFQDDRVGYHLEKAVSLANGAYQSDACFYSVPDCSARVSPGTREAILDEPGRFALVFVDCHN